MDAILQATRLSLLVLGVFIALTLIDSDPASAHATMDMKAIIVCDVRDYAEHHDYSEGRTHHLREVQRYAYSVKARYWESNFFNTFPSTYILLDKSYVKAHTDRC